MVARHSLLTLENIKRHDQHTLEMNNRFYPKISKLADLATHQYLNHHRTSTNFTGAFSIFDALYDLESFQTQETKA